MSWLTDNLKRLGLMATGIVLLSVALALSESAPTRSLSLSVFPEEIKLSALGAYRVLFTVTARQRNLRSPLRISLGSTI